MILFSMIFRSNIRMVGNKSNAAPVLLLAVLTITEIGTLLMKAKRFEFVALRNLSNSEPRKDTKIKKSSILLCFSCVLST